MRKWIKLVSALLMLTMASGRMITAACEIACVAADPASRAVESESAATQGHTCHESAAAAAADSTRIASGAHQRCHDAAAAPVVLTSKSARNTLESSDLAVSTSQAVAATNVPARGLRAHTPPALLRAPIATLRI